ncbi:hypothetical protein BC939DRAFT_313187 [Gamsiella multidivaricata]|uniref:uncharacterized protein n=1 Tax=Gamsiella multidivaricata TaxID=101098 RepID=UPI00221FAE22|nr:uncharacterized protein BC939DRAFT_313187 [Gamsiella multidivaricata]KAI7817872.1 hypothetical protein BC939DRAFT_313187 [Gamsiella multidivaricata]
MDPWDTPAASTMPVSKWDTNDAQASSSASHGSATASDADHDQWEQMKRQMEAASISNDRPHSGRPSVTLKDVWPTFMEADQARDLDDVKAALAGLCEASKGGSWKDLEHRLRDENCNTYLVATEDNVSFGYTLVNLKSEPNQQYRVIPSFIKPGTVKRGRMSIGMAASYEENFARLDNAGVVRPSGVPNCHNCKQDGHIASECREEKRESERSEYFGKCYNCGSEDHRTRNCNEPRKWDMWRATAWSPERMWFAEIASKWDTWHATAASLAWTSSASAATSLDTWYATAWSPGQMLYVFGAISQAI